MLILTFGTITRRRVTLFFWTEDPSTLFNSIVSKVLISGNLWSFRRRLNLRIPFKYNVLLSSLEVDGIIFLFLLLLVVVVVSKFSGIISCNPNLSYIALDSAIGNLAKASFNASLISVFNKFVTAFGSGLEDSREAVLSLLPSNSVSYLISSQVLSCSTDVGFCFYMT